MRLHPAALLLFFCLRRRYLSFGVECHLWVSVAPSPPLPSVSPLLLPSPMPLPCLIVSGSLCNRPCSITTTLPSGGSCRAMWYLLLPALLNHSSSSLSFFCSLSLSPPRDSQSPLSTTHQYAPTEGSRNVIREHVSKACSSAYMLTDLVMSIPWLSLPSLLSSSWPLVVKTGKTNKNGAMHGLMQ